MDPVSAMWVRGKGSLFSRDQHLKLAPVMLIVLIMLGLLLVNCKFLTQDAEAVGGFNLHAYITFNHDLNQENSVVKHIDVAPGDSPIAQFEGWVVVSRDRGSGIIDVNLSSSVDTDGFLSSVTPPLIQILPGFVGIKFTLSVVAPLRANMTDGEDRQPVRVTVSGSWLASPSGLKGEVKPSTVLVNVRQFYDLSVSVEPPFFSAMPGTSHSFDVVIKNMGNGVDEFEVSIINDEFYTRQGFSFFAKRWKVTVGAGLEGRVTITVSTPKTYTLYESTVHAITLDIKSKNSQEQESTLNPRRTQYDLIYHCKGAGLPLYFTGQCWAFMFIILVLIIVLIYNLMVYRQGVKRGEKNPIRANWKRQRARMKERYQTSKAKSKVRREERARKRAEKKAIRDAEKQRKKEMKERIKSKPDKK